MQENNAQHDTRLIMNSSPASGRLPYVAPEITFVEDLEALAGPCGKADGGGGDCGEFGGRS